MEVTMNRKERAKAMFKEGFSCSQAILAAFSDEFGLPRETALRISQGFGGGMARMAETCGALTGAFMVIGLKNGRTQAKDDAAKEKTYALCQELVRRFRARHGSLRCKELLGSDIGTPEGAKIARNEKLHDDLCPHLIVSAAEILEDLL
jgi:C_GCAxxG_C_C family probable redox protein